MRKRQRPADEVPAPTLYQLEAIADELHRISRRLTALAFITGVVSGALLATFTVM